MRQVMVFLLKMLIAGFIATFLTTFGKQLPRVGPLIAALPLVTIMTIILMILDDQPDTDMALLAYNIGIMAIGTVAYPMSFAFLVNAAGLQSKSALLVSVIPAMIAYWCLLPFLKSSGA
jgi:hypothetical protein